MSHDELMGMVATEGVESIAEAEHIKRRLELAGQKQRLIDDLAARDERIRLLVEALRECLGWTHRAMELEVSRSMQEAAQNDAERAKALLAKETK